MGGVQSASSASSSGASANPTSRPAPIKLTAAKQQSVPKSIKNKLALIPTVANLHHDDDTKMRFMIEMQYADILDLTARALIIQKPPRIVVQMPSEIYKVNAESFRKDMLAKGYAHITFCTMIGRVNGPKRYTNIGIFTVMPEFAKQKILPSAPPPSPVLTLAEPTTASTVPSTQPGLAAQTANPMHAQKKADCSMTDPPGGVVLN